MTLLRIDLKAGTVYDAVSAEHVGVVLPSRDSNPNLVLISVKGDRRLLEAFLARLESTAALSCPAADLTAAIDIICKEES